MKPAVSLMRLLYDTRKGDVVIVWELDRLARSLRQLVDTTVPLSGRGVELHSLTETSIPRRRAGKLPFITSPPWRNSSAAYCASGSTPGSRRLAGSRNMHCFYAMHLGNWVTNPTPGAGCQSGTEYGKK